MSDDPELVAQQGFASAVRGFDKAEVRAFQARVAEQLRAAAEREHTLLLRLRDAEERAAHPEMDEATLTAAVGEETARILRSAQEAAAEIRGKAEEGVTRARQEAEEYATRIRQEADTLSQERTREAEETVAAARTHAAEEAERIAGRARADAEALLAEAKVQCEMLIAEAESTRERVLGDLSKRRLVAATQVEQLRAGRERLLDAYRTVRRTLEEVTDDLQRADAEARAAAEAAGRRLPPETEPVPMPPPEPVAAIAGAPASPPAEQPALRVVRPEPEEVAPTPEVAEVFARLRAQQTEEPPSPEPEPEPAQEEAPAPAAEVAEEAEPAVSDADETMLQQRDAALQQIEAGLARRLKRALQDEQNHLLDRLRSRKGRPAAADVLPALDAHTATYVSLSAEFLSDAARAGAESVPSELAAKETEAPSLDDVGADLAASIVEPLRRRLERAFTDNPDDDASAIADRIGAAYRELKTQRIEQVAADHVVAAHTRGVFNALAPGTGIRWVVSDSDGPCPDCDDNVLAGTIAKGEPFPTGQLQPPAHAGCQCLVVPEALPPS